MISIGASVRLKASWGSRRLARAIDGDEDALADIPKIIDDASRNVSSLLKSYKERIESLSDSSDKGLLNHELRNLQRLLLALKC